MDIKNLEELKEMDTKNLEELTKEEKELMDTPEYKELEDSFKEVENIKESFKNEIKTFKEENPELALYNSAYFNLEKVNEMTKNNPEVLSSLKFQLKDSVDMTLLKNHRTSIKGRKLKQSYGKLKTEVFTKLESNKKYHFSNPNNVKKALEQFLPEDYKEYAKILTCHIYSFITESKINKYGIFITFLLLNIYGLEDKERKENELVIKNLCEIIDRFYK